MTVRARLVAIAAVALGGLLGLVPDAQAAPMAVTGDVGVVVDADATDPALALRHVGDPAPAGHGHEYQWTSPRLLSTGDVHSFSGTIDITDQAVGSVAMIGWIDRSDLAGGATGWGTGAMVYVHIRNADRDAWISVTDGNAGGGEFVQKILPVAGADLPDVLDVTFTVDAGADPATCASHAVDVPSAEGCMTLVVDGIGTVSDSYGSVTGANTTEFSAGAVFGWDSFPSTDIGVSYDLVLALADPSTRADCAGDGWQDFGFDNRGACNRFVNTGADNR